MSERVSSEEVATPEELDGERLLQDGREARHERAEMRTLKGRVRAMWADKSPWAKGMIIGGSVASAVLLLALIVEISMSFGRIHPGVRVGDISVGALAPDRAAQTITESLAPRLEEPLLLTFEEQSWTLTADSVSAELDVSGLVDAAMAVGRTGSVWEQVKTRATLWLRPHTVPVVVEADDALLQQFLTGVAEQVNREPVDAAVVIEGTEARIEPAVVGISVNTDEVTQRVVTAFTHPEREVPIGVNVLPVDITDVGANHALRDAVALLDGPVVVTYDDKKWTFDEGDIAEWIAFRKVSDPATSAVQTQTAAATTATAGEVPASIETTPPVSEEREVREERFVLEAYISAKESSATITAAVGEAGSPPVDARFDVSGGNVTIIPSRDGVGPDIEAMAAEMTRVLTAGSVREVQLRTERREPALTTQRAQQMGIKERFATYTTTFSLGNRARLNNIQVAAAALDHVLIPPGGVFSFNGTVGPSTVAKGYQAAGAIVDGELRSVLGGGVCQVATTLFNTVFESGLPVVERRNHSFYIASYPRGRDATVWFDSVDLKFRNDTEQWVLIATSYTNTTVTVNLYGTAPGYVVNSTTGNLTDVRPYPTREIVDNTLAEGVRRVQSAGVAGKRVVVTRTVTKGGAVVREDSFVSTYRPREAVVRTGTRAPAPSTTPTTTVTP